MCGFPLPLLAALGKRLTAAILTRPWVARSVWNRSGTTLSRDYPDVEQPDEIRRPQIHPDDRSRPDGAALRAPSASARLADEYGAAQERGEVAAGSVRTDIVPDENDVRPATAAELGLSRKDIHEARLIRDAERAEPGIVRRTLDEQLARGEEPTRAALRRAVSAKLDRALTNLKAAEEVRAGIIALPKAPPSSDEEKARQISVFGTQADRAILARICPTGSTTNG